MNRRTFTAAAAAAVATTGTAARAQTGPVLRVAAVPIDVGALSYFADQQGFFKKHGLNVEIITGANGPAIAAAVVGGSMDIGDGNTTTLALAHERGVPFVLIAPSGAYSTKAPTGQLVVLKTSPINSAKDLAGKTIGLATIRNISEVASRAWLEKNGVSGDSVHFLELPFIQMSAALQTNRIDAAMIEEPTLASVLATNGRVLAQPYDAIAPEWIEGGYFCTLDFAKAHPDVVKRFSDAMAEAAGWANANHPATLAMLETYSKSKIDPNITRIFYPERVKASLLQPLIDASAKYGVLKASFAAKDMIAPNLPS